MKKLVSLFASFALMCSLVFVQLQSTVNADAPVESVPKPFACIISGDVYEYVNGVPMNPLFDAHVEVVDTSTNLVIGDAFTNGNGFYEIILDDHSGQIKVSAYRKSTPQIYTLSPPATAYYHNSCSNATFQDYFKTGS